MKKTLDWLLEAFMWIYEIFLYSLVLPLFLGIIWMFGGIYIWFMHFSWAIKIPLCIGVGICLKIWRNNYLKNEKGEK
ncbi:MAG: hypothetical protein V1908_04070 [Candidatus Peregrinibacteria bacterium]